MRNSGLRSLVWFIIGIVIFIVLLPVLAWMFIVGGIIVLIFIVYSKIKHRRFVADVQNDFNTDFFRQNSKKDERISPDVIDVEYSEKEDDSND